MPGRTDISSILVIGAGPIVIGQACEFDYSGTQAVKALRDEGYRVILVNSNPATIMTDPGLADATYVEPITPEVVARVIERERPDALLPTMGGQTALNTARSLATTGVLERFGTELIGATLEAIDKAEDRERFRNAMERIGLECARGAAVHGPADARAALDAVGLPAIIRPSFTLGGTGGGVAYNREQFDAIVRRGLDASPVTEVLVEESVLGWKEYEMEVVRDRADNCIIVCSIENVDPMGVHTGDSITVAPALTLTDKEYQVMRNASFAAIREIGVDTGGSNVQFAVDPGSGRMVVVELNPRVSRSSALASKATGFPIAKVAAKLAVGYTLDEIRNDLTKVTPASFEPAIDYVVTKVPRFTFEKFPGTEPLLTTSMKSVGEAMAIGRTFPESLQKALRSMETGLDGLDPVEFDDTSEDGIVSRLARPSPDRILAIAQAMRHGFDDGTIHAITRYDPWFLEQLRAIVEAAEEIRANGLPGDRHALLRLKKLGFSDRLLARLAGPRPGGRGGEGGEGGEGGPDAREENLRTVRENADVRPVFKRVDTCAAEFASSTSYLYSCYEGDGYATPEDEAEPSDATKIIILGGGPNRIGQGIEFDYCCVHACLGLREAGFETIMVNCNPETVSTDYDTSDRLYLEPLTVEDVIAVARAEMRRGELLGVIVQLGGQTPLRLALALERAGIPVIGTSTDALDRAEDRERFQALLRDLGLRQPPNGTCRTVAEAREVAARIGYPIVVRPSYVLGGRAMEIVHGDDTLERYVLESAEVAGGAPILIDRFLQDAVEIDVDALADGRDVFIAGIMEHIEEAGIHSGDSACSLPPCSLPDGDRRRDPPPDEGARPGARGGRPHERAVRGQPRRRDQRAGGQPAGEPHRSLRRQGHRCPDRPDRGAPHGRRGPGGLRPGGAAPPSCRGKGSGLPLRPLPGGRRDSRAGDEVDRGGDGPRPGTSGARSRRPSSRPGGRSRRAAARSSPCATATSRRPQGSADALRSSGSLWSQRAGRRAPSTRADSRPRPSTRCSKGRRTSSTLSRTAASTS